MPREGDQLEYGGGKHGLLHDYAVTEPSCKTMLTFFIKSDVKGLIFFRFERRFL